VGLSAVLNNNVSCAEKCFLKLGTSTSSLASSRLQAVTRRVFTAMSTYAYRYPRLERSRAPTVANKTWEQEP
jgi:hypothetical protein